MYCNILIGFDWYVTVCVSSTFWPYCMEVLARNQVVGMAPCAFGTCGRRLAFLYSPVTPMPFARWHRRPADLSDCETRVFAWHCTTRRLRSLLMFHADSGFSAAPWRDTSSTGKHDVACLVRVTSGFWAAIHQRLHGQNGVELMTSNPDISLNVNPGLIIWGSPPNIHTLLKWDPLFVNWGFVNLVDMSGQSWQLRHFRRISVACPDVHSYHFCTCSIDLLGSAMGFGSRQMCCITPSDCGCDC